MRTRCVFAWILTACCAATAAGQEFSVTTKVFDDSPPRKGDPRRKQGEEISSSSTLFHAGKVYDHLARADEMTIFEPAHQRFIFISEKRRIAATLTLAEIDNYVHNFEKVALENIRQSQTKNDSKSRERAASGQFQLNPAFKQTFDPKRNRLQLLSDHLTYNVSCADETTVIPEAIESYLRFADAIARLNCVTNGHILPAPRVALNTALRQRRLLPVNVVLQSHSGNLLHLRAEHKFEWQLTTRDRDVIVFWEQLLKDPDLKQMPFDDYQRATLSQSLSRR